MVSMIVCRAASHAMLWRRWLAAAAAATRKLTGHMFLSAAVTRALQRGKYVVQATTYPVHERTIDCLPPCCGSACSRLILGFMLRWDEKNGREWMERRCSRFGSSQRGDLLRRDCVSSAPHTDLFSGGLFETSPARNVQDSMPSYQLDTR